MKKIIFFSKNLDIGGMEKSLVSLLNSLVEKYNITLVLEEKKGSLLSLLDSRIIVKEYHLSNVKFVPLRKVINLLHRSFWTLKYRNKYDFSCNYATYSVIGSKLSQVASYNSSLYVHSNYYDVYEGDKKKIDEFFIPHYLDKFKNIIFVSNESKNKLVDIYPNIMEKSLVINNLIDYEEIIKLAKENTSFNVNNDETNFIFIGRLDNQSKNFDLMLESFKKAFLKNNKIKLYIVGNGPYKERIIESINEYHINKNVILIDETINPYVYLNLCDCLVLTSNYEGFPVVYLEALVLNKSIMTTINVSDDYLSISDYAILVKANSEEIANKIISYKKVNSVYDIDFKKFNENKINKIIELIEVNKNE